MPWLTELGPPIYAPSDFDLTARIKAVLVEDADVTQRLADEDDGVLATPQEDPTVTLATPQPPKAPVAIPPLPVFEDAPTSVQHISKHQLHAREHSKKRRRAAAATALEETTDGSRRLKASAKRHRDNAVPLQSDTDVLSALESVTGTQEVLALDDAATAAAAAHASDPIITDYSLKMENVAVASTAFQGRRYKQTAADREPKMLEQLRQQGIDIVEWNG